MILINFKDLHFLKVLLIFQEVISIPLTKREKDYIETILTNDVNQNNIINKENYDLNYRLKKKFLKLHDDYWSLVAFFKLYDQKFQKRSTNQTTETLLKAKSQIASSETLVNTKCFFCKGSNKKMLEINICVECSRSFGI